MLTEQQCETLIGKNDHLDDVVITTPVGEPTSQSMRDWMVHAAAVSDDLDGEFDLVDVLEAILERTEQRWYVEKYLPKVEVMSARSAAVERKLTAHFMETGKWGLSQAEQCGVDQREAKDYLSNCGMSPKTGLRNYALDVMIDHPDWDTKRIRLAMSEFGPAVSQNAVHIWRHDRKDPRTGERRGSLLDRRRAFRGLLAEGAEGEDGAVGTASMRTSPSAVGASA